MPSWIPTYLHDFFKWVFEALGALNEFVRQIVASRRDIGLRDWAWWMHEDLGSRPYHSLRADYVPPFLAFIKDKRLRPVVCWSSLILLVLSSARLGCLHLQFWSSCCHDSANSGFLLARCKHRKMSLTVLGLLGKVSLMLLRLKGLLLLGAWMVGPGIKLGHSLPAWFSELAGLLGMVESLGVWPTGFV